VTFKKNFVFFLFRVPSPCLYAHKLADLAGKVVWGLEPSSH
jgi:hypothetical protein